MVRHTSKVEANLEPRTLFLIDGAAGTGKSDLLDFVDRHLRNKNTTILRKFTTRKLRDYEERSAKALDLEFVSDDEFDRRAASGDVYHYTYPRAERTRYGIHRGDLARALESFNHVFLIVRSARVIREIIDDFPLVSVYPLFVYTLETAIPERLRREGCTEDEIEFRLSRSAEAMDDLYNFPTLYRTVLVNNCDRNTYQRQLQEHFLQLTAPDPNALRINNRDRFMLPAPLRPHKPEMLARLRKHPYEKNVFLMMDFSPENDRLSTLIKRLVEVRGFTCVRADEPVWSITNDDVYNPYAVLYCCKYGIAVFNKPTPDTTFNINVAIELAMMHFQDKRCLMLKEIGVDEPPFDLAHKIFEPYSRSEDLVDIIDGFLDRCV